MQAPSLVERLLLGDVRALARLITVLENTPDAARRILAELWPHTGRAQIVGITGPPGAGKSTLVDGLISLLRAQHISVAVLAVDPSSPYTGGAVLGDRIRMGGHARDAGVFVRSMGARGHLGGLARAAEGALLALDAAGWQVILVETVGVGQSELEIAARADVTVVVLTPAAGDAVQTLKAGLLEAADVLVVNKSDMQGAALLVRDLRALVARGDGPALVETEARTGRGLPLLWEAVQARRLSRPDGAEAHHRGAAQRVRRAALGLLERELDLVTAARGAAYARLLGEVTAREVDPETAARRLLTWWRETPAGDDPR